MSSDADRLLAGCCIDNEQGFLRLQEIFELLQFLNERLINFLASRGIEDVDVRFLSILPFQCSGGSTSNILLVGLGTERGSINLFSQYGQLLNRRRALQIACY